MYAVLKSDTCAARCLGAARSGRVLCDRACPEPAEGGGIL